MLLFQYPGPLSHAVLFYNWIRVHVEKSIWELCGIVGRRTQVHVLSTNLLQLTKLMWRVVGGQQKCRMSGVHKKNER